MPTRRARGNLTSLKKHEYYKILPPQLEKESDFDYLLFAYFCFLGHQRSLKAMNLIIEKLNGEEIKLNSSDCISTTIRDKSYKNKWTDRSRVFDCTKIVQEIDKLIQVDESLEAEWINKRHESRIVLQKALTATDKLIESLRLLVDDAHGKLTQQEMTTIDSEKLSRVLLNCISGIEKSVGIIRLVWEQKENIEALEAGRQVIESALLN